jgi:hypothetical protein
LAGSDSDDSDNERRVVRSEKAKRLSELSQTVDEIRVREGSLQPAGRPQIPRLAVRSQR